MTLALVGPFPTQRQRHDRERVGELDSGKMNNDRPEKDDVKETRRQAPDWEQMLAGDTPGGARSPQTCGEL